MKHFASVQQNIVRWFHPLWVYSFWHTPDDFDNYCKRVLKCKRYLRYVDDFVIFENSKEKLLHLQRDMEMYLEKELALVLREKKILKSVSDGLDFLGYIIRPKYVLVRRRVVKNFKYIRRHI